MVLLYSLEQGPLPPCYGDTLLRWSEKGRVGNAPNLEAQPASAAACSESGLGGITSYSLDSLCEELPVNPRSK